MIVEIHEIKFYYNAIAQSACLQHLQNSLACLHHISTYVQHITNSLASLQHISIYLLVSNTYQFTCLLATHTDFFRNFHSMVCVLYHSVKARDRVYVRLDGDLLRLQLISHRIDRKRIRTDEHHVVVCLGI